AVGNSNVTSTYNTIDVSLMPVNYYRLKQTDADGSYTYSQIILIRNSPPNNAGIKLYPNPVINYATVTVNSDKEQIAHIKLYTEHGMLVSELVRPLTTGINNIMLT